MNTLHTLINPLLDVMPTWAVALLVLLTGWCLALAVRLVVSRALAIPGFTRLCTKMGISEFLRKGQVEYSPAKLLGALGYWVVLIAALFQSAVLLDLTVAQEFSRQIAATMPKVLGALFILILGLIVVSFIAKFATTIARNAGVPYAALLGKVIKWGGSIFIIVISFEQLQAGSAIIGSTFQTLVAAVAFGAALAFGLGCKDMARNTMEQFLAHLRERHRDGKGPDLEG